MSTARRLWRAAETLHAVTYFHPDALEAHARAGARGFWMGYFAARLSPLGPVGPDVATAVCFNFSPERPRRALPDAWGFLDPADAVDARARGAAAALRATAGDVEATAAAALAGLDDLVEGLDPSGRPLGAANLGLVRRDDPVERLWQACTTLREHRGDGHVAALVAAGLDGCETNVLAAAVRGMDPGVLQQSRAWSDEAWSAAGERLADRGLIEPDAAAGVVATDAGRQLMAEVELLTDRLAGTSYRGGPDLQALCEVLEPVARAVAASGTLPYPNPIGVPPL